MGGGGGKDKLDKELDEKVQRLQNQQEERSKTAAKSCWHYKHKQQQQQKQQQLCNWTMGQVSGCLAVGLGVGVANG